jgi:hypothetical protein
MEIRLKIMILSESDLVFIDEESTIGQAKNHEKAELNTADCLALFMLSKTRCFEMNRYAMASVKAIAHSTSSSQPPILWAS